MIEARKLDENNPYAAPHYAEPHSRPIRAEVVAPLRIPSIALLSLSLIWTALFLATGIGVLAAATADRGSTAQRFGNVTDWEDLAQFLLALPSGFIAYSAWCMRRSVHYHIAFAGGVLACIPFVSPWIFFGIPFGFWSVIVLLRQDVIAAFSADDNSTACSK